MRLGRLVMVLVLFAAACNSDETASPITTSTSTTEPIALDSDYEKYGARFCSPTELVMISREAAQPPSDVISEGVVQLSAVFRNDADVPCVRPHEDQMTVSGFDVTSMEHRDCAMERSCLFLMPGESMTAAVAWELRNADSSQPIAPGTYTVTVTLLAELWADIDLEPVQSADYRRATYSDSFAFEVVES